MAYDCVLLAAHMVAGTLMLSRWFLAIAVALLATAAACQRWPRHAVLTFSAVTIVVGVAVAVVATASGDHREHHL